LEEEKSSGERFERLDDLLLLPGLLSTGPLVVLMHLEIPRRACHSCSQR